jgi:hypothetical protein
MRASYRQTRARRGFRTSARRVRRCRFRKALPLSKQRFFPFSQVTIHGWAHPHPVLDAGRGLRGLSAAKARGLTQAARPPGCGVLHPPALLGFDRPPAFPSRTLRLVESEDWRSEIGDWRLATGASRSSGAQSRAKPRGLPLSPARSKGALHALRIARRSD